MKKKRKYRLKKGLRCNHCKDEIFSLYRWDFQPCKCGKIFVDGGDDYFRYGFEKKEDCTEIKRRFYFETRTNIQDSK